MARLQNTTGGSTPVATLSISIAMIYAILTYSSEVWYNPNKVQDYDSRYLRIKRLEYQSLRCITGAYNGSGHRTLAGIAGIELLKRILDDIQVSWFARTIKNVDS